MNRFTRLPISRTLCLGRTRSLNAVLRPAMKMRYYTPNTSGIPLEDVEGVDAVRENGEDLEGQVLMRQNGENSEGQVLMREKYAEEEEDGTNEEWIEDEVEEDLHISFKNDGLDVQFPNLMNPDPLMDLYDAKEFPPDKHCPWPTKIISRNDPSMFRVNKAYEEALGLEEPIPETTEDDNVEENASVLLSHRSYRGLVDSLMKFPLMTRRITQQTGKGKIHRMYAMIVVGNGKGLVGLGEGKAEELPEASRKAFAQAVRNIDYVERFEDRTIWTDMESKLGATRIIMRPRPVGFGLQCNPNVHQVLKAAGIKDISAKVWGSRNPLNVIKATFRMLQAGHAPLAMGDGIGGGARKLNKGSGVVGKEELERMRGRKLFDLRTT